MIVRRRNHINYFSFSPPFPQFPHTFPQTYQNFNFSNKTNFTVTIDFKYFPCTAILLPCLFIFPHGAYNVEMSLSRVVRLVYFSTAQGDKIIHNWHFFFSFSSEKITFSMCFFKSRRHSFGFPILIHRKQVWFSTGKDGINGWKSVEV